MRLDPEKVLSGWKEGPAANTGTKLKSVANNNRRFPHMVSYLGWRSFSDKDCITCNTSCILYQLRSQKSRALAGDGCLAKPMSDSVRTRFLKGTGFSAY